MLSPDTIEDSIARALVLDLAFLGKGGDRRHAPFSLTPSSITATEYQSLIGGAIVLGRLTQALAADSQLMEELHAPLATSDAFFAELLSIQRELHGGDGPVRVPLLLQRSDFMLDQESGPRLVECNSIAAGMAPFGEQITRLHEQLRTHWPADFSRFADRHSGSSIGNKAISQFALAVASAAQMMRDEHADLGTATFLMVVQEDEDNIFDQRLLEHQLEAMGIHTIRRTFRQLHEQLYSGPNQRLMLRGSGAIDLVYLRAGYRYCDYLAPDLDEQRCCDALRATRLFIERHRVVVNATVAQQLATSKRTQQYLSQTSGETLSFTGLSLAESNSAKQFLVEMRSIDDNTLDFLGANGGPSQWVLKNQGEGGGHCVFDEDIVPQLRSLAKADYAAWVLMRRLRPKPRGNKTVVIRDGEAQVVGDLVSEIGFFTAHMGTIGGVSLEGKSPAYLGYLVRSKPGDVTEGGVHSGSGVLDSLVYRDE